MDEHDRRRPPGPPTTPTSRWCRTSTPTCSCAAPGHSDQAGPALAGVVLLDGSRRRCRWGNDRDAVARGILGPRGAAARDAHGLRGELQRLVLAAERALRLTGFPRIIGPERTQRLLRTRLALMMAEQRLAGTDGLGPPGFTLATLQKVMFGNRNLCGELARDTVVAACRRAARADLAEACEVLAALGRAREPRLAGRRALARDWSRLSARRAVASPFDPAARSNTPRSSTARAPNMRSPWGAPSRTCATTGWRSTCPSARCSSSRAAAADPDSGLHRGGGLLQRDPLRSRRRAAATTRATAPRS